MSNETKDKLRDKKEALKKHIPFIREMLQKLKNSAFELKWKRMLHVVSSDTQVLTDEYIAKLENTLTQLKNEVTMKKAIKHQPMAIVKKEIIDSTDPSIKETSFATVNHPSSSSSLKPNIDYNNTKASQPDNSMTSTQSEAFCSMKSSTPEPTVLLPDKTVPPIIIRIAPPRVVSNVNLSELAVKNELLSPLKSSTEVSNEAETEAESDTGSERKTEELVTKKSPDQKSKGKKRKINRVSSTSSSEDTRASSGSNSVKKSKILEEDDQKVSELKNIIKKLSEGDTKNSKEFLDKFENVIGRESFCTLKTLFTESLLTSQSEKEVQPQLSTDNACPGADENVCRGSNAGSSLNSLEDQCSSSDNEPLDKLVKQKKKPKRITKRSRRTEIDKLNQDISDSFICDGVLAASGLRKHKKIPYLEHDALQDFEFDESLCSNDSVSVSEDAVSVDFQKSSSVGDGNEKEILEPEQNMSAYKIEFELRDCSLIIPRLILDSAQMPVKILANGKIHQSLQTYKAETIEEIDSMATNDESKMPQLDPIENLPMLDKTASVDDEPKNKPIQAVIPMPQLSQDAATVDDGIITIDDDDDDDQKVEKVSAISNQSVKIETLPQTLGVTRSKTISEIETTVYHLSYVKCRGGFLLKCNCKCDFGTYDEKMFQYHIQTRHLLEKWSGSCKECQLSVSNFGSLLDEYNHMNKVHIKKDSGLLIVGKTGIHSEELKKRKRGRPKKNDSMPSSPATLPTPVSSFTTLKITKTEHYAPTEPKIAKNASIASRSVANPVNTPVASCSVRIATKPTLKIRCLPGDKLSTVFYQKPLEINFNNTQPSSVSGTATISDTESSTVPQQIKIAALKVLPNSSVPSREFRPVMPSIITNVKTNCLQPWLPTFDNKYKSTVDEMLTKECLLDMFKCMGSSCFYHTNNCEEFSRHLRIHEKVQAADSINYGRCAYCAFNTKNVETLVQHLKSSHKYDKHACTKCFYRSVVDTFVCTHQQIYHHDKSLTIFECDIAVPLTFKEAVLEAKESRKIHISPIICVCCRSKFFNFDAFEAHFKKQHPTADVRHRCNKCLEESNASNLRHHLENCHNIKMFHCVNCRFGASDMLQIKNHLMNTHANKFPFFCHRVQENNCPPDAPESLTLKHIGRVHTAIEKS